MDLIQKAIKLGFIPKNKEYYLWELQKWLREVHKIDVFCDCIGSGQYFSVIYNNNVKEGNDKVFEQQKTTFYEEALEVGLQEALKELENFEP